jgi:hypothetical protein
MPSTSVTRVLEPLMRGMRWPDTCRQYIGYMRAYVCS